MWGQGEDGKRAYAAVLAMFPSIPPPAEAMGAGGAAVGAAAWAGAWVVAGLCCCCEVGFVGARAGTVGRLGARPADL